MNCLRFFPEGVPGIAEPLANGIDQNFLVGHVELAIQNRADRSSWIVGAEEQMPSILLKKLGKAFVLTPFNPHNSVPLPVITIWEPTDVENEYLPESADDPKVLRKSVSSNR